MSASSLSMETVQGDVASLSMDFIGSSPSELNTGKYSLLDKNVPPFQFVSGLLERQEIESIQEYAANHLGDDPSSKHFILRKKAIAFVLLIGGDVFPLEQDYFVQSEFYNDFSGGYRRVYTKISTDILQSSLKRSILHFAKYWGLPDKSILLVQIQRSIFDPLDQSAQEGNKIYVNGSNDVTGQGIHTDGSDRAMILCCERDNVRGAENCFHSSLTGENPLCAPRILEEGDTAYFKDNSIFHHVSDAFPEDDSMAMHRTMVLMHYPGDIYLTGARNPSNLQPTRPAAVTLRKQHSI